MTLLGRFNEQTGDPEIIDVQGINEVEVRVALGDYHGFAFYKSEEMPPRYYIIVGPYFEGEIPTELFGRLLEVRAVKKEERT